METQWKFSSSDMSAEAKSEDRQGDVLVMFSGGSDSTLTASLLSEQFRHVHLLTYSHKAMGFDKKCLNSLEVLKKRHGELTFVHHFLDLNALMAELFFTGFSP